MERMGPKHEKVAGRSEPWRFGLGKESCESMEAQVAIVNKH